MAALYSIPRAKTAVSLFRGMSCVFHRVSLMTRYPERRPHRTKLALMRPIESTDGAWNVIGAEADGRMTALKKKKKKRDVLDQVWCMYLW